MERPRFSFPHTSQANAGDSRSVLSVKGEVKALSFDHKPTNVGQYLPICQFMPVLYFVAERARISGAGGYIEDRRVNGTWIDKRVLVRHVTFCQEISPCHAHWETFNSSKILLCHQRHKL